MISNYKLISILVATLSLVAMLLYAQPTSPKATTIRWEYKTSFCDEAAMNNLGSAGWELVSTTSPSGFGYRGAFTQQGQFAFEAVHSQNGSIQPLQPCISFFKRPK